MAQTTVYHPTASQFASAACHLDRREDWRTVRIDGTRYVVLQSGNSQKTYILRADAAGCQCVWYERTGQQCSHMLALELAAMLDELEATATPALNSLTTAVEYAAFREQMHQRACRARMADRPCQVCLDYEAEWLAADDALHAFLTATAQNESCDVTGCAAPRTAHQEYCETHRLAEIF